MKYLILLLAAVFMVGCTNTETSEVNEKEKLAQAEEVNNQVSTEKEEAEKLEEEQAQVAAKEKAQAEAKAEAEKEKEKAEAKERAEAEKKAKAEATEKEKAESDKFKGYKLITVDGGNLSGYREANVVVDIGYGNREYWAFTNKYGQLVRVIAKKVILQDDDTEPVTSSGRYYSDEAKVPGVERADLDEGHILADSLGGVSNAYNITPQDSTLNRHGDQAYMENGIRKAGGATNFEAIITYADTKTQIPSHYKYTYTLMGNEIVDEFDNGNPDKTNAEQGITQSKKTNATTTKQSNTSSGSEDVSAVDTNGNGQVTIQEAKDAGFSMPIMSDHWLYQYMDDRDGDGSVGE